MKRIALTAAVAVAAAAPVAAQPYGGRIALYTDPAFTSSAAGDTPGVLTVYVVHEDAPDAVACWFRLQAREGFTGVWTGDTVHTAGHYGDSQTGIHMVYVECQNLPYHILTVTYALAGDSGACTGLDAVAVEGPGARIRINGCIGEGRYGNGGGITINPTTTCSPVPIQVTTWGEIRSLYGE